MDQAVTAGGPRYQLPMQGQSSDEAVVSSDHVYEWGNLARFLRFRLANGVDCQDFNNFFFGEVNRMAIVVGVSTFSESLIVVRKLMYATRKCRA